MSEGIKRAANEVLTMPSNEPWYHFVGGEKDSILVPPGYDLIELSDPQAFALYAKEIRERAGPEAVHFAEENCLLEYSFGLLKSEEIVSYCSLYQAPKPDKRDPSLEELISCGRSQRSSAPTNQGRTRRTYPANSRSRVSIFCMVVNR